MGAIVAEGHTRRNVSTGCRHEAIVVIEAARTITSAP